MRRTDLIIDNMIVIDDNGMPKATDIRQLMDKDIRTLYQQDKSKDKSLYL